MFMVKRSAFAMALRAVVAQATGLLQQTSLVRPLLWPTWQTLPVAGLDVLAAQSVLYSLRHAAGQDAQGEAARMAWLQALMLAQIASDRLLHALSTCQTHLHFWRARLKAGYHRSFLLLSQGPTRFATDVAALLGLRGLSPPPPLQQAQQGECGMSASDRIEERIAALELLSTQLSAALAEVHRAADTLRLLNLDATAPQQQQRSACQAAVLGAVSGAVAAQVAALQDLLPQAAELQDHGTAARQLTVVGLSRRPGSNALLCSSTQPPQPPAAGHKQQQQPQQHQEAGALLDLVQQDLLQLGQLLSVKPQELPRHSDAGAALAAASRVAARLGPMLRVPLWAAMPSSLQRQWIKYTLAAGVGVYAGFFLYRNSRLAGSDNLDTWVATGVDAVRGAWVVHIVRPLLIVRDELFATFRDRPSIVTTAEFESDKASLLRMITDFQQENPAAAAAVAARAAAAAGTASSSVGGNTSPSPSSSSNASSDSSRTTSSSSGSERGQAHAGVVDLDVLNRGMQVVMHAYEADLKKPIRGLVAGDLARTLLIQVQRLKLDTEAAMLELDQILRANELSISLVAAVPALLVSWTLLRALWVLLLVRPPPDPRKGATPCRLAMAELERALAALAAAQQRTQATQQQQQPAVLGVSAAEGVVLYKLYRVFREAHALYALRDASSRWSDWPHMSADLVALVDPGMPVAAKLDLHRRMLQTYTVLKP